MGEEKYENGAFHKEVTLWMRFPLPPKKMTVPKGENDE